MKPTPTPVLKNTVSSIHGKVSTALSALEASPHLLKEVKQPDVIVARTKHKCAILAEYVLTYKTGTDSIVTRNKGKQTIYDAHDTYKQMCPSLDKQYRVIEVTFYNSVCIYMCV